MAGTVIEQYIYNANIKKDGVNESGTRLKVWDYSQTSVVDKYTDGSGNISVSYLTRSNNSVTATSSVTTTLKTPHRTAALKYGVTIDTRDINVVGEVADAWFLSDNDYITQSSTATVLAYAGCVVNHSGTTVTLTSGTWSIDKLYDYLQAEACITSPQYANPRGIMVTVDGLTYTFAYDLVIQGLTFNGQSRNLSLASGKELTFEGVGRADNLALVAGDAVWASATTMENFDVTEGLDFTEDITIGVNNCTLGDLTNSSGGTVTLNFTGDSTYSTKPASIIVNNAVTLVVSNLSSGDSFALYRTNASGLIDRNYMLSGAGNSTGESVFLISGTIPDDTPTSGKLRIAKRSGTIVKEVYNHTFSGISGSYFTGVSPTLSTEFSASDSCFAPFMLQSATNPNESATINYAADRTVLLRWRKPGFQPFEIAGNITNAGYSQAVLRINDPVYA